MGPHSSGPSTVDVLQVKTGHVPSDAPIPPPQTGRLFSGHKILEKCENPNETLEKFDRLDTQPCLRSALKEPAKCNGRISRCRGNKMVVQCSGECGKSYCSICRGAHDPVEVPCDKGKEFEGGLGQATERWRMICVGGGNRGAARRRSEGGCYA